MVTGAATGFRLPERTAKLLAQASMAIGSLSILVHGKARIANGVAGRQFLRGLCIAFVQRDHSISPVDVFYQVIDGFHIVAFVAQEGALMKGKGMIGAGEYLLNNSGIRHIGGGSQLIKRQTGNAVHQHMVFVSPVELITPLIVLVGCGVDAQGAVRVNFGMVFRLELI